MLVTIQNARSVGGTITAPPSKSMAHRAVLCAALAEGRSHITNLEFSKDISATLGAAAQLCARVRTGADDAVVEGWGILCPCRAGGLLRERQHPALSHPHRQPDRTGSFLHRPRAADGAAQSVYEALYREQGLRLSRALPG